MLEVSSFWLIFFTFSKVENVISVNNWFGYVIFALYDTTSQMLKKSEDVVLKFVSDQKGKDISSRTSIWIDIAFVAG